jgi:RNA-splicing ligase RtcB
MTELFRRIPAGVGSRGFINPTKRDFREVMRKGAGWCIGHGYGWIEDLERIEERGCIEGADPSKVTDYAIAMGLTGRDQIVVMVHCGSRGFGHQVAGDYLKVFEKAMRRYGITVKDQQLACAPFRSPEGQDYFAAMNYAANTAFANRQVIRTRCGKPSRRYSSPRPMRSACNSFTMWRTTSPRSSGIGTGSGSCTARGPREPSDQAIPNRRTVIARSASR